MRTQLTTQLTRTISTAASCVGLTLVTWVALVMLLERLFRGGDHVLWSGTLWLSAMSCTGAVTYFRHTVRPAVACTAAFALFGLIYMACEGPIFGAVSEGGNPSLTESVVLNLSLIPFGAFVAAEVGGWLGRRRRAGNADEQTIATAPAGGA